MGLEPVMKWLALIRVEGANVGILWTREYCVGGAGESLTYPWASEWEEPLLKSSNLKCMGLERNEAGL